MALNLTNRPKAANTTTTSIFEEWCAITGWHGILDLYLSKSLFLKLSWLIVILVGIILSVDQCMSLILDFAIGDKWMTSVTFEMPNNGVLEWPNITVCNLNQPFQSLNDTIEGIDSAYLAAYWKADDDALLFYDFYQAPERKLRTEDDLTKMKNAIENISAKYIGSMLPEYMKTAEPKCHKTALHCGSSSEFDLRVKPIGCCDQDAAAIDCFSILSYAAFEKNYKNPGRDSAVYVLLNPQTNNYYDKLQKMEIPSAGLMLTLYYGERDAAVATEIILAPGTHTMVSMVKEIHRAADRGSKTIQFHKFKKPCLESHEHSYQYMNYDVYSKPLCEKDCFVQLSASLCDCLLIPSSFSSNRSATCAGTKIFQCTREMSYYWQTDNSNDKNSSANQLNACCARCTEACDYETIDTKVSTALFPAPVKVAGFTTYLNRAFADSKLNFTKEETSQLIFFEMFYEMKEYRVIEKVSKTSVDELISNLGGALGVWTGLSMLSIFQCFVFASKGVFAKRDKVVQIRF